MLGISGHLLCLELKDLNYIYNLTDENLLKLHEEKCNLMIFSIRAQENFTTRLAVNNHVLHKIPVSQLLGVWISEDLSWAKNTKELCRKAYSRMSMLTKLRYVGVSTEDLIEIYILFIRSTTEYCSVAFHSSLTIEQSTDIERVQKASLKVILGESYVDYTAALCVDSRHCMPDVRKDA